MKKLLLSLGLGILSFAGFSQVQLNLTGSCQYAGGYDLTWTDDSFWDGSGGTQTWNTPNMLVTANAVTGNMVLLEGANPVAHGNCTFDMAGDLSNPTIVTVTNAAALAGNIAVIRRGNCQFGIKALAAQNAGAIACIIVNASGDPIGMAGGTDGPSVTIPTIMVSANTGAIICDAITAGCPSAFIGNIAGYYNDNLSCKAGDVYRPGRALDFAGYDMAGDTHGFTPGALITNLGINDQIGITVTCEVFEFGNATPIYTETSPAFDILGVTVNAGIPSANNNWVSFTNPFTTTNPDMNYEFVYTINAPNTPDATPTDNEVRSFFGTSSQKMSLAQIDPNTGNPKFTGGAGPRTDVTQPDPMQNYWEMCSHFKPNYPVLAGGNWFQAYTYDPVDPTALTFKTVKSYVYEWERPLGVYDINDVNFSADTNILTQVPGAYNEYFYQGDYQDSIIYVEYDNIVTLDSSKHYLFCNRVEANGDVTTLKGFNFRIDKNTDYNITNGAYWDAATSTGVPSPTNGSATTALRVDGSFFAAGFGYEYTLNSMYRLADTSELGLKETENNRELIAYPNPAVDMITIPFGAATGNATINIIDVAGRTVSTQVVNLTGGNVTINVTDLESGLYTFNVNYADGSRGEFKIVIAK